jgi:hypothetical protein
LTPRTPGNATEHRARADRTKRALLARHECKYYLAPSLVPALRDFLKAFVEPDGYAPRGDIPLYPVCSLYLDSPDLRLYRGTVQADLNRYKLRVRTYDDLPSSLAHFEIKARADRIVHKLKASLPRGDAQAVLDRGLAGATAALGPVLPPSLSHFLSRVHQVRARPVMRVKYWREAYESRRGEPVRVTFDRDLQYAVTPVAEVGHEAGEWNGVALEGAIVELKFTDRFPLWVRELVRAFDLRQCSIPKYVLCVDEAVRLGQIEGPSNSPRMGNA